MPTPRLYESLNLRWNPFGEPLLEERVQLAVAQPARPSRRRAVQILGDAGHGKTTRLLATLREHTGAHYHYVPEGSSLLPFALEAGATYLIDEAQRLRRYIVRRLLSGRYAVVIASHEDLERYARIPVRTEMVATTRERLASILARRLEWAQRGDGPPPQLGERVAAALTERFGSDVRAIEDHLYEVFQRPLPMPHQERRRFGGRRCTAAPLLTTAASRGEDLRGEL